MRCGCFHLLLFNIVYYLYFPQIHQLIGIIVHSGYPLKLKTTHDSSSSSLTEDRKSQGRPSPSELDGNEYPDLLSPQQSSSNKNRQRSRNPTSLSEPDEETESNENLIPPWEEQVED